MRPGGSSWRVLVLLTSLAVLLAAGGYALAWRAFLDRPLDLPEGGLVIQLAPGERVETLARNLAVRGVLVGPHRLSLYARLSGQATRLQAGEYRLTAGMTPRDLLRLLADGRVVQHSLTIVEGWTFRQVLGALGRHQALAQTLAGLAPGAVMERMGAPDLHPEGRFLPETYRFPRGTSDADVLRRAYRDMATFLAGAWETRDPALPLKSVDEALVLASIIERETEQAAERPLVAGVLVRRLQKGMLLQVDPTVIYGLGEGFDGNLRKADLARDTPYNTYVRSGLPPTPIAMPGRASVLAALHPAAGTTLFYVSRGDGSHQFSDSYDEHRRAVMRYQTARPAAAAGASATP